MEPYQQLEVEWAKWNYLEPSGMVACSSGTAALHLALEALRLPPGSEVLTGDFNMIAVPRAITMAGLTPVFLDCDERLLVDIELIRNHQDRARAVIYAHIYGRRCDMGNYGRTMGATDSLRPGEHWIIEDLAEAHGVHPHPLTDAACWSFYKNKIVAGEEGGAVWFRDPEHAKLARQLRSLGFTDAHDFMHVPRGHNYRMSNAHAELVLKSIREYSPKWMGEGGVKLITNLEYRKKIEKWYDAACPAEWRMPARDAVWVYDLQIPGLSRAKQAEIVRALNASGIAARMSFAPMSIQPEYKSCRVVGDGMAAKMSDEVFYLPVQPGRTTEASCRQTFEIISG